MRKHTTRRTAVLGLCGILFAGLLTTGCPQVGGGVLSILPFAQITAVQLFDEPDFTIAFSVTGAVSNPAQVSKINWVFGDGGGFVEGPAGRTTITHQYANTGTYQVTAFVFGPSGFIDQINSSVTVMQGDGSGTPVDPTTPERPGAITNPSPADNAVDVSLMAMLSWSAGARATSHDVYLGTDEAAVEAATRASTSIFRGNFRTTSFDPDDLPENTTFFWRIDEVNTGGTTKGSVLMFKTARAPAQARSPIPVDGSTSARVNQVLRWTAGSRATSHDVYCGKDQLAVTAATKTDTTVFKGNQAAASFDPSDEDSDVEGDLLPATVYYWRIDEVGPGGTTRGLVWSFQTRAAPPAITGANPADLATNVAINSLLTWTGSPVIESYDVYFGTGMLDVETATRSSPEFRGNQLGVQFNPGALLPGTQYFWRIDTLGPGGTSRGAVMSFTTAPAPPMAAAPFSPSLTATNVPVDTNLEWTVGAGGATSSFDVFLSTDQNAVTSGAASALQGNQPAAQTLFNPATNLLPNTIYFWRIDAIGPGGRTNGSVWTFRTGTLANQAETPFPAIGAVGVAIDVQLSWSSGMNANGHNVYFGTNQNAVSNATKFDAEFRGFRPLASATYAPGTLLANTEYFWRIDETAPGGETKGAIWRFTTGPAKAINPNPQNGSTDGSVSLNLSWSAGTGATSHDVYLGMSQSAVGNATRSSVGIFRGNQTGTSHTPSPVLEAGATYFWRIDEVATVSGNQVITRGDVWQFATGIGKATSPNPADQATSILLTTILQWTAGAGGVNHDVYFGTDQAAVTNATRLTLGVFRGTQSTTNYDPPESLSTDTEYFWRIDTIGAINDLPVTKKGDVWRFRTLALPTQASSPAPLSGASNVATSSILSWEGGTATSYDVYFGTINPPPLQGNQTSRTFSPALAAGTTYFWRIDTKNSAGTTTGVTWSFSTAP